MLAARLAGVERRAAVLAEIGRGTLPPGSLGRPVIEAVCPIVDGIVAHVGIGEARAVDVRVGVPGGRSLGGTVAGVVGDELRRATYSRIGARQRLAAWVRLLALTAAAPARPWSAVTVGRALKGDGVLVARIPPPGPGGAPARAPGHDHRSVRPRHARAAAALLPHVGAYVAAGASAARDAMGVRLQPREGGQGSRAHARVRPRRAVRGDDGRAGAAPTSAGPAGTSDETTRFGRWARRLWDGLLAYEELMEA